MQDGKSRSFTQKDGLLSDYVFSLHEDRDGALWVGTGAGVSRFKNGRFTGYARKDGLADNMVRAITSDNEGNVWIGTQAGLSRLNNGKITNYTTKEGLSQDFILSLLTDREGRLWIGTRDGLDLFQDGKFTQYKEKDGLAGKKVTAIYEDEAGTFWIATDGGLSRFANGKFTTYTSNSGLFTDFVFQILEDDRHDFWMSSNIGIFRVSRKELEEFARGERSSVKSESYDNADGLKSSQCNGTSQPAGWKTRDGRIWFATAGGAVNINPESIKFNPLAPPVHISAVVVDRNPMPLGGTLNLHPGKRDMEFHYAALSFLAPEKIKFKYQLEGFDQDWIAAGSRREAYYTNLPPGNYKFRVKAANSDGVWNESGAEVALYLEPHIYQTRWFNALFVLIFVLSGIGIYLLRVATLREREMELSRRVEEAMAKIKVLHGLLPICAACKKIRDNGGDWNHLEVYMRAHADVDFTHGICPECSKRLYPEHQETAQSSFADV
jgi:ligand-binding sensor domain-containing protein